MVFAFWVSTCHYAATDRRVNLSPLPSGVLIQGIGWLIDGSDEGPKHRFTFCNARRRRHRGGHTSEQLISTSSLVGGFTKVVPGANSADQMGRPDGRRFWISSRLTR